MTTIKNIDYTQISADLANNVSLFVQGNYDVKNIKSFHGDKIKALEVLIADPHKYAEGTGIAPADYALAKIALKEAEEKKMKDALSKVNTYQWSKADLALRKAIPATTKERIREVLRSALSKWSLEVFGVDYAYSKTFNRVLDGWTGEKFAVSASLYLDSEGAKCTQYSLSNTACVKYLYGVLYEEMVRCGRIQIATLPDYLRTKEEEKREKARLKKAAKKAAKKTEKGQK